MMKYALLLLVIVTIFTTNVVAIKRRSMHDGPMYAETFLEKPTIISDYLPDADAAREASRVVLPEHMFSYIPKEWEATLRNENDVNAINMGYAGYITVNKTWDSNTFYWFFPAMNGDANAPLLMWMNGGPGATSLYGLFEELGPFSVDASGQNLVPRNTTWNNEFAMVFVDNPVGTGFSYTNYVEGFNTNEDEVASNLYSFLTQFFGIYPAYTKNEFFVTGESYAGKYVPAISSRILRENANPSSPNSKYINLQGISLGDSMVDPINQLPGYGDLLYSFGMASKEQYAHWIETEQKIVALISQGQNIPAFDLFDAILNGDFYQYPTYYHNTTGLTDYFNFLQPDYPPNNWQTFVNSAAVRKYINVGDHAFNPQNSTVEFHLLTDWFRTVAPLLPNIFANVRVLMYNGQNDIILSSSAFLNFLEQFEWSESKDWRANERFMWTLNPTDSAPAGYIHQTTSRNFTYAMVRDAGHLLPQDQPDRALDMITRFIKNIPYQKFTTTPSPSVVDM